MADKDLSASTRHGGGDVPELVITGKTKEALEIAHRDDNTRVRFPAPVGIPRGVGVRWTYTLPEPLYREMVYRMHCGLKLPLSDNHLRALRTDLARIDGVDKIVKEVQDAWSGGGRRYIDELRRASEGIDPDAAAVIMPPRGKNNITVWCRCPYSVRVAPGYFKPGGIVCNLCGHAFEPRA